MIQLKRDPSGLYLSTDPADSRVAFLFQDPSRTDPTFQLTAQSWTDANSVGFIAFFAPSKTRDWKTFADGVRAGFGQVSSSQIGWFPEPLGNPLSPPTFLLIAGQGTSQPTLSQSFSLAFRQAFFQAQTDQFGGTTTVLFDDSTNSIVIAALQSFQLSITPPGAGQQTYPTSVKNLSLVMTGALAGTANVVFQLDEPGLALFEAGVMYFAPPQGGSLVGALRYPVFRAPGGTDTALNITASLDVVNPLDPLRTFFQFTDALLGSYFVTATGKTFALQTVNADITNSSRLVFASRPQNGPSDAQFYYLTPAGQFGLAIDGDGTAQSTAAVAQMLCGVTGTEFLRVGLGATPDALQFVPGKPAWRIMPPPSNNAPVFLDATATTSWAQFVSKAGAYISQPERSPLFSQSAKQTGGRTASGLSVHVLGFAPTDAWRPAESDAPPTPLAPYAALDFATQPSLDLQQYLDMESAALNPTRANAFVQPAALHARRARALAVSGSPTLAMTPQGMLVGLKGDPAIWDSLQIAISSATPPVLEFDNMGASIQKAVQQNQIFTVISADPETTADPISGVPLFNFTNRYLEIGDWTFDLSPAGQAAPDKDATPPIFIMKFYPGKSIADLAEQPNLWSQPDVFNTTFSTDKVQAYLTKLIAAAQASVYPDGPNKAPDPDSLYWNFCQTVTSADFSGILVVNCNMQLDLLPPAIRSVLGGMKDPGVAGFRVHHVGIAINDTDPLCDQPALAQSSMFALVDYEATKNGKATPTTTVDFYGFEVEYLRALFTNSELRTFACKVNLTINNLFKTGVTLQHDGKAAANGATGNVVAVMGSYEAHATSGDTQSSGQGVYSFIAEGTFTFDFGANHYLQSITLTKLQFSFDQETAPTTVHHPAYDANTSHISAHFGIWGSLTFANLNVLDVFSFDRLVFSNLGIDVGFDLTICTKLKPSDPAPPQPVTGALGLAFAPGDLRFDVGGSTPRTKGTSLLSLLPFKLKSFLYSANADQTIESLNYYSLGSIPGLADNGIALADRFSYALIFDLDLGSMGGLVGSLSAFKFSILIGWLSAEDGGDLAFGVQLPQVNGKLEIKIEGVLTISIEQFNLEYATKSEPQMLVLGMHNCYIEILGKRLPPEGTISIGLFAPSHGADQIGWIGAFDKGEDGGGGGGTAPALLAASGAAGDKAAASTAFDLDYLGIGQRVGPDPTEKWTDFDSFLKYMKGPFWDALKNNKFSEIYHPDGKWIILTHFTLIEKIELGLVFYDATPFYDLLLRITAGSGAGFSFEITYTKVSDTIGVFAAKIALPDKLRTFEVGAASVTLPTIAIDVYTNGDWKVDLGYPDGDNWSVCFRVEAMVGPIPVTGSGGFYVASLSSATDPGVFKGTNYASILAFGLAVRLGVGKDFTAGPLKAGVSVTFFGIIEGASGYLSGGLSDIFKEPDALALQGQFGVIGEIYGTLDFVIIKASVNVRLEASIGIILLLEPSSVPGGGDGSIVLYIQASVSVSVTVEIDLFLFTIYISFSFDASFRFEWQLAGSRSGSQLRALFVAEARAARLRVAPQPLPLCPGLPAGLPLMFLPELTVVFSDAASVGAPWLVASLGVEYAKTPPSTPTYAQFKPFEAVATQLATFALVHALNLAAYNSEVLLDTDHTTGTLGLKEIDSDPELLTGWLDYPTLLGQLSLFTGSVAVPNYAAGTETYAALFPMPPFLKLATDGRVDDAGRPIDLAFQFGDKNPVPGSYAKSVDDYFNQLFVNQTPGAGQALSLSETQIPLIQEIFLDYFKGLVRGAVHELLVTMQKRKLTNSPLDQLFMAAVGDQRFAPLAAQMSSAIRGGVRLPALASFTVAGGPPPQQDQPYSLYALLWQEFPVGNIAKAKNASYTVTLTNPDTSQAWLAANASYTLTEAPTSTSRGVAPYENHKEKDLTKPGTPTPIALTQTGPQAFAFENAIVWNLPTKAVVSLRPFPPGLARLQRAQGAAILALIKSRPTDGAYLPDGTRVDPSNIIFATTINLTVKQIPGDAKGSFLPDVYALSGARQTDEALLGQLLAALRAGTRPVQAIQILYPPTAGAPGLVSATIDPTAVFALRTNTTTVSQPPVGLLARATAVPAGVSVGATLDPSSDGGYGFLQIIQQATVTNAPGYYLRYIDTAGNSLDKSLFAKGPATLTLVVTYLPGAGTNQPTSPLAIEPYCNSISLAGTVPGQLYYAETTDPALATRYVSLAAGSFGVELSRADTARQLQPTQALAAAAGRGAAVPRHRSEMIKALHGAGVTDAQRIHRMLDEAGNVPAQLNALYGLVTYQVEASAGFIESNVSAPIQSQKPTQSDPIDKYRVIAPLYNVATANRGVAVPDRYASIGASFTLSFFVNDAFGNQLPTSLSYTDTNYYFDPILPLDQWQGVVPTYDFANPKPNLLNIHLTPSEQAFDHMSPAQTAAALTHYRTINDQITGPGVTFYVETNLALQADGASLVPFPLAAADTAKVTRLVSDMIAWLSDDKPQRTAPFPAAVDISVAVSGPGALPPLFDIAVLFGIERDASLISPYLKDVSGTIIFPPAQNVATPIVPATGGAGTIAAFAKDFTTAFPALKLAVGMNGADAPQQLSKTGFARMRLKARGLANDGTGAGHSGQQSIWAVAAGLLDVSIGTGTAAGPRFLSPKPLQNTLNSATVPLPVLDGTLPPLPGEQLFVDVDLDQLNRAFFQAVDDILLPASAAKAFALDPQHASYAAIANGRESLAQKYARFEVDWLFDPNSPFTGSPVQATVAREVFEQQMRAALMTAYSVDTIVQYDVAWNGAVSPAADGFIELFGQVEAMLGGLYAWSGTTVTATTTGPHYLSVDDKVLMNFTPADPNQTAPVTGVYSVTTVTDDTFAVTTAQSGQGTGTFSATRQNAGLSTAHVGVNSKGPSPLTFLYGNPDVAQAAVVTFDLRFSVTNLQYFLAPPDAVTPGEARPSIWLQLVDPYRPHIGPAGTATSIPAVLRQYPTPPTLIKQAWQNFTVSGSGNPIADDAHWSYVFSYQAMLADQDQINGALTYNTDLRPASDRARKLKALALGGGPYDLFTALARFSAVNGAVGGILSKPEDPKWGAAVAAFAASVDEVEKNTDWNPLRELAGRQALVNVTDLYVTTDKALSDGTTRHITLQWPAAQGQSTFVGVAISVTALDPASTSFPLPASAYPNQQPITPAPPNSSLFEVENARLGDLGVAHLVAVNGLNVLAAENAIAAIQIERNLIPLRGPDNKPWYVVPEFIYLTSQVRPSQPVTPFIEHTDPIDVTTLPHQGTGAACPVSKASLCQRVYTIMNDLLADPVQAPSLLAAHAKAGVTAGTTRRVKVGCSYRFPVPGVAGGSDTSINPLVPVVLARSFDIDGNQPAQLGDFAIAFSAAIAGWASDNGIVFGPSATPVGAALVFDITLYAGLSGVNTPVLRLANLQLKLTEIDPT